MRGASCHGLPTKVGSRLVFTCEKEYVATQMRDTYAGGVHCHHNKLISYPHVFFPQVFLFSLSIINFFFLLLSCVLMTLNISLIWIVYCIQSCMSLMSSVYKHNLKNTQFTFSWRLMTNYTPSKSQFYVVHNYLQQLEI
jgi:hypothetical protein